MTGIHHEEPKNSTRQGRRQDSQGRSPLRQNDLSQTTGHPSRHRATRWQAISHVAPTLGVRQRLRGTKPLVHDRGLERPIRGHESHV